MTESATYLMKVIVCSGILYIYYHLFLRNSLFHHWNRFYLLFATALSLVLPLIKVDLLYEPETQDKAFQLALIGQTAEKHLEEFVVSNNTGVSTGQWQLIAYSTISLFMFLAIIRAIYRISVIIRSHSIRWFQGIRFITTTTPGSPFSFLNYIFWNADISLGTKTGRQIFQHEMVHVKEKHTWDKLYMQVLIAMFWCNPFFWLFRNELKHVHEFIADKKAVGESGVEAFATMILQTVYPQNFQSITNQFFQSSIKRRLFMLKQVKNPRTAYVSRIIILPLLACLVLLFALRTKANSGHPANAPTVITNISDTIPKKEISSVDIRKNKTTGTNEIALTYKDGSKEVLTEKEAMQRGMINNNLIHNPGQKQNSSEIRLKTGEFANPLYILDGKEVTKDEVGKLNPGNIESIDVWKDKSATEKYGEKGRSGVIDIKTKKNNGEPVTLQSNGLPVINGQVNNLEISKNSGVSQDSGVITVVGRKTSGTLNPNDPVFEKAEFEASVNQEEWKKFLQEYTQPIVNEAGKSAKPGKYTAMVRFIVEKDGTLSNFSIIQDPGHNIGRKVLEIMKYAPKWKPAIQNQKVVRSYYTQPITFVISTT